MTDFIETGKSNLNASRQDWIAETHFLPFPYGDALNNSFRHRKVIVVRHKKVRKYTGYECAVYLLHGFGHNSMGSDFWFGKGYAETLDILHLLNEVEGKKIQNTIFVCPDGSNCLGGTMWENSEFNGPVSDWLTSEVTKFIDVKYGTPNNRDNRVLAGHSMGAQASVKLLMTQPQTFGSAYAFSGMMSFGFEEHVRYATHWYKNGCPTPKDILAGNFDEMVHAYSAMCLAFCDENSPSGSVKRSKGELFFQPTESFLKAFNRNWPEAVFENNPRSLNIALGFSFDVGREDEFSWGVIANRRFEKKLKEHKVRFAYEEYDGSHSSKISERFKTKLLPFLKTL